MDKSRAENSTISGSHNYWVGNTPGPATPMNLSVKTFVQKTSDQPTGWPLVRPYIEGDGPRHGAYSLFREYFSRQDYGGSFRTEKSRIESTLNSVRLSDHYLGNLIHWFVSQDGPVLLAGFPNAGALSTDAEWSETNQIMFSLGGRAIARVRPGKPMINLPVAVGELAREGIPSMINSLMLRSRNLREVFRNSGSEYLNVQFGWAPLLRDIQALAQVAAQSRLILEKHQDEVDKLIRRRYHFDPTTSNTVGLSFPSNPSSYMFMPGTPLGAQNGQHVKTFASLEQVHEETQITTNSWFSGGFRFYFPDIPRGLEFFAEIERNANTLLGTRLDPEVLWNLAPWTWLLDWFVNVGDVVSNASAIIADQLVMQFGYMMRTTTLSKVITLPGIYTYGEAGWLRTTGPFSVMHTRVMKARAKASPFGFGFSPSDFSSDQWAILGALGISRGLR